MAVSRLHQLEPTQTTLMGQDTSAADDALGALGEEALHLQDFDSLVVEQFINSFICKK